ncbi:MAG: hypothetical protein V3T17_06870 [Pseudomonadales bacterium]
MESQHLEWVQQAIIQSEKKHDTLAADYYKNLAAAKIRAAQRCRQEHSLVIAPHVIHNDTPSL